MNEKGNNEFFLKCIQLLLLLICISLCLTGAFLSFFNIINTTSNQEILTNNQSNSSNDQETSTNNQPNSSNDQETSTNGQPNSSNDQDLFYIGTESYLTFKDAFKDAVDLQLPITYRNHILYEPYKEKPNYMKINIKEIYQYPELPRGCEVTSLAMLLNYKGLSVNKMELAAKIKKDTTPYKKTQNKIYYGNPYDGFVGNMYDLSQEGYGVYHGPLTTLAKNYSLDTVDLTGISFDGLLSILGDSNPILVITNSTYKGLMDSEFEYWHTPTGIVKITMKEHSVVLTGYDQESIYFKDPLKKGTQKAPLLDFKESWEQMGNQAITILK